MPRRKHEAAGPSDPGVEHTMSDFDEDDPDAAELNSPDSEVLPDPPYIGGQPLAGDVFGAPADGVGRPSQPQLFSQAANFPTAVQYRVWRWENGVPVGLGVIDINCREEDFIRTFYDAMPQPGQGRFQYKMRPIDIHGKELGREFTLNISEHHAELKALREQKRREEMERREYGGYPPPRYGDPQQPPIIMNPGDPGASSAAYEEMGRMFEHAVETADQQNQSLQATLNAEIERKRQEDRERAEERVRLAEKATGTVEKMTERMMEVDRKRADEMLQSQKSQGETLMNTLTTVFMQQQESARQQAERMRQLDESKLTQDREFFNRQRQEAEDRRREEREAAEAQRRAEKESFESQRRAEKESLEAQRKTEREEWERRRLQEREEMEARRTEERARLELEATRIQEQRKFELEQLRIEAERREKELERRRLEEREEATRRIEREKIDLDERRRREDQEWERRRTQEKEERERKESEDRARRESEQKAWELRIERERQEWERRETVRREELQKEETHRREMMQVEETRRREELQRVEQQRKDDALRAEQQRKDEEARRREEMLRDEQRRKEEFELRLRQMDAASTKDREHAERQERLATQERERQERMAIQEREAQREASTVRERMEREAREQAERDRQRQHDLVIKEMEMSRDRDREHAERLALTQRERQGGSLVGSLGELTGLEPGELLGKLFGAREAEGESWVDKIPVVISSLADLAKTALEARAKAAPQIPPPQPPPRQVQAAPEPMAAIQTPQGMRLVPLSQLPPHMQPGGAGPGAGQPFQSTEAKPAGQTAAEGIPPLPPASEEEEAAAAAPEASTEESVDLPSSDYLAGAEVNTIKRARAAGISLSDQKQARRTIRKLADDLPQVDPKEWMGTIVGALASVQATAPYIKAVTVYAALAEAKVAPAIAEKAVQTMKSSGYIPPDVPYTEADLARLQAAAAAAASEPTPTPAAQATSEEPQPEAATPEAAPTPEAPQVEEGGAA